MTRDELHDEAMALPGATWLVQWGGSDVYKVGGKVFATCGGGLSLAEGDHGLSFKVSEIGFMVLTEPGAPGRQAPYFAKGHWVNVPLAEITREEARGWLASAHGLIAAKLSRAVRAELGL